MRERKYRAWHKYKKRMYKHVCRLEFSNWNGEEHHLVSVFARNHDEDAFLDEAKNWELLDYTGLKDKNGKEIYEGDIIKGEIETLQHIKGRVYIESEHGRHWGCFIADGPEGKDFGSWDMRQLCWGVDEYTPHCEIIGNIYENPDLLSS